MFISLVALALAIWQAKATIRHNKLTVSPHLRIDYLVDENISQVSLMLKNCGVGPAIIFDYKVFLDGNEIKDFNRDPDRTTDSLFGKAGGTFYWLKSNEDIFEVNGEAALFEVREIPESSFSEMQKLISDRLSVAIAYRSIYKENFEAFHNRELA